MNFESKKSQEMMNHSSIGEIFHIEPQGGGTSPGGTRPGTVPARRARKRRFQKGGKSRTAGIPVHVAEHPARDPVPFSAGEDAGELQQVPWLHKG